jgi:hypothetical protein
MFSPGNHQYQIDQQRRNRLLQEARREQLLRKAAATSLSPRRYALVMLQIWQSLFR